MDELIKGITESAISVYSKTGIVGLLVFVVFILILVMMTFLAKSARKHALAADAARKSVEELHQELLDQCMEQHREKDEKIVKLEKHVSKLEERERVMKERIAKLEMRVRSLEAPQR